MGSKQKAIDAVLALLPSLSEKEKAKVRKALQMRELDVCERLGHNYKAIKNVQQGWLEVKTTTKMICTRCGKEGATV